MSSHSSCVNCSGDSRGVEVGVGRAGDDTGETESTGETGRAGGGGDERADGCGSSRMFEQAGDGSAHGADRIRAPACA
jgi:hypothetical protein